MDNKDIKDNEFIKYAVESARSSLYKSIEGDLNDLLGLCLDQLELSYPHRRGDNSDNEQKFNTAKRMILNRFNQFTLPSIQKTLNEYNVFGYNETMERNITFARPTKATGPRLG